MCGIRRRWTRFVSSECGAEIAFFFQPFYLFIQLNVLTLFFRNLFRAIPAAHYRSRAGTDVISWPASSVGASGARRRTCPACAPEYPDSCLGFCKQSRRRSVPFYRVSSLSSTERNRDIFDATITNMLIENTESVDTCTYIFDVKAIYY